MKVLYSIGIYIYGILLAITSLFNKKARKLFTGQRKALTLLKKKVNRDDHYIWIHVASLGEFEQGRPLIEYIKENHPEYQIVLTFYSPSGYEVKKNYQNASIVSYLPLDTPYAAKQFIKIVKPEKAIFIKYEFWPNYLLALKNNKIPTFLVSSIFRKDQLFFKSYGKWYKKLLNAFNHIFVQDVNSLQLLQENGIMHASIAGDTRFDRVVNHAEQAKKILLIEKFIGNKPVIIAGSTWQKDENLLIRYLNDHPDLKMIIVPHEVNKTHLYDTFKMLQGNYIRYTEATETNITTSNCLVIDSIGILSSVYQYSTIAYIGGGFGAGIHNTLEAAVYGVPVVFGPNYEKFKEARDLIEIGGGFSIHNYQELTNVFNNLLSSPPLAGKAAGKYVKEHTGATNEIMQYIV